MYFLQWFSNVFFFFFNVFIYFWLCWVFIVVQAFSSCDASHCCKAWALGHLGFSSCGCQALEHWFNSCGAWAPWYVGSSQTRDQTCLLHWQADSLPLSHQGSPQYICDSMARINKLELPWPDIKLMPPTVEAWGLNHWPPQRSPNREF